MAVFGINLRYAWFVLPIGGFFLGKFLDDEETLRMISFRDKSQLYQFKSKKGEEPPPSWP